MIALLGLTTAAQSGEPLGGLTKGVSKLLRKSADVVNRERPPSNQSHSVEQLASEIDWLEHHLDVYGSVIPKQPDVWGQARLTTHRSQVEKCLEDRLGQFNANIQGSIRRSDIADLSFALALGLAADGRAIPSTAIGSYNPEVSSQTIKETKELNASGTEAKTTVETTTVNKSPSAVLNPKDFSSDKPSSGSSANAFTLEPVLHNEQLFRYLNALNQLRRINEGDDNSDSPGYSLNLVRIPVSVLPGKHTSTGYGAEITFTAEPVIGPDLLPNTFRQLVINDLVDQLALPITQFLSDRPRENTAKMARLMKAEAEADLLAEKMAIRIEELKAVPGSELIVTYFEENFEYLRSRFLEISMLAISLADARVSQKDFSEEEKEASFNIGLTEFRVDPRSAKPYVMRAYLTAESLLKGVEELMLYKATVQRLQLQIIDPSGKEYRIEHPLVCVELPLGRYAEYVPGQMPYQVSFDLKELSRSPDFAEIHDETNHFFNRQLINLPQEIRSRFESRRGLDPTMQEFFFPDVTSDNTSQDVAPVMDLQQYTQARSAVTQSIKSTIQQDGNTAQLSDVLQHLRSDGYRNLFSTVSESATSYMANFNRGSAAIASPARQRRSLQPLPPSQFESVFGNEVLYGITQAIARTTRQMPTNRDTYIHLGTVRRILQEELSSSYDMMSRPEMVTVWQQAGPVISNAVVGRQSDALRSLRKQYLSGFQRGQRSNLAAVLSWAIIVESSLLNDHMQFELNRLASESRVGCAVPTGLPFFGIDPPQEAREAFRQYVMARWPIQVFALDPVTQDQNINDDFSLQRNLQLAAAVAFAKGNANLNTTLNFMRKLQTEMQTIALNRTAVGFSHGQSTFGWRFYPRVQSPDTPGTLGAFGQTLFGGPNRADLLKQRQLEPGSRECTAVVVMPSFVPFVNIHSRSSWFSLANPSSRELTVKDAMRLSAACESISKFTTCVRDSNCYRPGDIAELSNVLGQLSERLPLRCQTLPVPYENALGGFQVFSSGAAELGVELLGWYGAPGISVKKDTHTTLFLVGRGFSTLKANLTVGGVKVEGKLLSREIMEVTVPYNVQTLPAQGDETLVEVVIANPYGVGSNLLIPIVKPEAAKPQPPAPAASWVPATIHLNGEIGKKGDTHSVRSLTFASGDPIRLKLTPSELVTLIKNVDIELLMSTPVGLAWAPEFKKPLKFALEPKSDGTLAITSASLASLNPNITAALNKLLAFKNEAPTNMELQFFIRGVIPATDKTPAISVADQIVVQVTLRVNVH